MSAALQFDAVHEALLTRGFGQAPVRRPVTYRGSLSVGAELVSVVIEFANLELQSLPVIRLTPRPAWIPSDCNHVNGNGVICYANTKLAFIDRFDAARQVLFCLDSATKVLRDIKRGNVLGDVDLEFASYWRGTAVLVDCPEILESQALSVVSLQLPHRSLDLVCGAAVDADKKYGAYSPKQTKLTALIIPCKDTPPADTRSWPPRTLQDFMAWLTNSSPPTTRAIRSALGGLGQRGVNRVLLIFQARPTWFGIGIPLPFHARRVKFHTGKAFVNTILAQSAKIEIERITPIRVDSEYVVERNLRDSEKSLVGKHVLLAGCGAIGGHVAHALARAGAGFGAGSLTLVDPECFLGGNIGRHRLGLEALLCQKSDALALDVRRSLPGVDVRAITGSGLDLPLKTFDLIVDASGEEQLSEALNARYVAGDSAPIIFVWITGNGIAVWSFTLASREQGCLHCWKSHGSREAFMLQDEAELEVRTGRGCDDPYAPFSGAAPLVAAGLATQAGIDWASGRPNPALRMLQVDTRSGHFVKPRTPGKAHACPACGPQH